MQVMIFLVGHRFSTCFSAAVVELYVAVGKMRNNDRLDKNALCHTFLLNYLLIIIYIDFNLCIPFVCMYFFSHFYVYMSTLTQHQSVTFWVSIFRLIKKNSSYPLIYNDIFSRTHMSKILKKVND